MSEPVKVIGKCAVHLDVDATSAMVYIENGLDYVTPLCQACMEALCVAAKVCVGDKSKEWFDAWLTLAKAKESK